MVLKAYKLGHDRSCILDISIHTHTDKHTHAQTQ